MSIVWGRVWVVVFCEKKGVLAEGVVALKAATLCFAFTGVCHNAKLVLKFPFCRIPGLVGARFPLL